jgi:hypothetical protein
VTLLRYLHLLAMAFFVGGQLFLAAVVLPTLRGDAERGALRSIARRFGASGMRHIRSPQLHALEGAIFLGSLAIVWLGVSLAH